MVKHVAEQQKQRQSLSPENKTQILCNDAAAHKKQRESLSPEQKAQIKSIHTAAHKNNMSCFPRRKKLDSWKQRLNNVMNI